MAVQTNISLVFQQKCAEKQCNAMPIMDAGVSLYAHINLTNCEKLLQFTL